MGFSCQWWDCCKCNLVILRGIAEKLNFADFYLKKLCTVKNVATKISVKQPEQLLHQKETVTTLSEFFQKV